jgi:hypothetical protein
VKGKAFFFEKKKQKTFIPAVADSPQNLTLAGLVPAIHAAPHPRHPTQQPHPATPPSWPGLTRPPTRFRARTSQESKPFFFEKKKQKTFAHSLRHTTKKSFLVLFSKKERLP